jgi:hypothetical protein
MGEERYIWFDATGSECSIGGTYPDLRGWSRVSKEPGPHAKKGREILEGMYAQGCTSMKESKSSGGSEWQ